MDFAYDKVKVSWHEYPNSIQFEQNNNTIIPMVKNMLRNCWRKAKIAIDE